MKIKEVSKLTGLTEKTIRYYEERLLIDPSKTENNGRIFRSYSKSDVETLNLIADLRKLEFSIADIIVMRDDPKRIPGILKEYHVKTSEDLRFKTNITVQLELIDYDSIITIKDLASRLKEMGENRPLPAADTELQFYKIDGLTKEELEREVQNYQQQLSINYRNKIEKKVRNIVILFAFTLLLSTILAVLIWKSTYFLGYIPSLRDDLSWRKILIPLFILLFGVITFVFVKSISILTKQSEGANESSGSRITRCLILMLTLSLAMGIVVQVQSLKSLENLRMKVGNTVRREWYELYRMTDYVDKDFAYPETYQEGDGIGFGLYVNQTCYNFPSNDSLHTKMYDLLIWSYDPAFKELRYSKTDPEDKEKFKRMLIKLNDELELLCIEILDKPEYELADLTRYDSVEAVEFRQRINNFVEIYVEQAESLFREINQRAY